MDKNTLVGFALIGAVIVGFGIYNRPSPEEMAREQHYRDSIEAVVQKKQQLQEAQKAAAEKQSSWILLRPSFRLPVERNSLRPCRTN